MPRTVFSATKDQFNKQPGPTGQVPLAPAPPAQVEANGSPNRVAAVEERERSTSAETELIRATMGISSANQQGQARCLLDTGADEHICPASFASWIKPESRTSGPRLRDAQGKVMQHGNNYRKIMLCVKTVEGMQLSIPVTFLIGPVQQPIISMGRLEDDPKANLDTKRRVLEVGEHKVDVDRVMRSYHLPVWLDKSKAEGQLEQIRQVKRLETKGHLVTFKVKPKQSETPRRAERPEASPLRPTRETGTKIDRDRTRGRSRARRRRDESSEAVAGPVRPAKAPRPEESEHRHERPDHPKSSRRPPAPRPVKDLDVQFFGRRSRRMKAALEGEDWPSAGPQYLGQDGLPITFKLYFGQRLQGETKESRKTDRTVCECGKVLKPTEASLWSHLSQKGCVPNAIWNIWDAEYKVRKDESPPSEEPPSSRPARSRAPTPAPKAPQEAVELRESRAAKAEEEQRELSFTPAHDDADFGLESSSESVTRGRRNHSPSPLDDDSLEDVPVEPEPEGAAVRKRRAEMSAEEKKRDNYKAREEKRRRKTAAKERQGKGKSGGGKGKSRRSKGSIRVVQFDGWIQASGLEADDDPPEGEDIIFDEEELREPPQAPEAAGVPPDVAPPEAIEEGEDEPADGGAADRPVDLGPTSKVKDLKKRLKDLNAPVWGSKEILWERLKEYEARLKSSREIARELQRREEAINRDPESARIPVDLPVPAPPSEVERELHNLTHLPFASWCEICLRSRTRDNPHRKMPKEEEATRVAGPTLPLVSMDWFEVKGSPVDEQPEGEADHGFVQCLLVTDAQTGYVAAIPVPEKKNQANYACEMVVKFLKLMRHTQFRLRADNEPALNLVVEAIKGVWPHWIRVDQAPLYSSASNGKAERAIQTVRRLAVTYRLAVEQRYGCRLSSTMTLWLVRHAAWSHNRFHVKIHPMRSCSNVGINMRLYHSVRHFCSWSRCHSTDASTEVSVTKRWTQ